MAQENDWEEEHLDERLEVEARRSLDPQEGIDRDKMEEDNHCLQSLDRSIEDRRGSGDTALDESWGRLLLGDRSHWEDHWHCCSYLPLLGNWEEHPQQQHGEACMDNCKARDIPGAFGDREAAVRCSLLPFRNCILLACHCCEIVHREEEALSSH